ncbi:MAG TPA: class I SAM-dependent methyltransferase [Acidobacteriota bacterium]
MTATNFDYFYFDDPHGVLRGYQPGRQGYINPFGRPYSWQAFLRRFFRIKGLRPQPDWTFLDIGCAKGYMVEALVGMGFAGARGIDASAYAIAHAPPSVRRKLRRLDVTALRPRPRYDVVFCLSSLQYLSEEQVLDLLPRLIACTRRYLHIETIESRVEIAAGDDRSQLVRPYRWWKRELSQAAASRRLPVRVRRSPTGNFYGPAISVWRKQDK